MMRFAAFSPHGFEMVSVTGSEKKPNDAAEDDKYDVLGGDAPQFGPQQIHGRVSGSSSTFRKFWPGNVLNKIKICYHGRKNIRETIFKWLYQDFLKFPPRIWNIQQVLSDQRMKCTATSCQTEQFFVGKSDRSDSFQELWIPQLSVVRFWSP